jgi:Ni,Fe-hydrogenase I cytochrome b subunit
MYQSLFNSVNSFFNGQVNIEGMLYVFIAFLTMAILMAFLHKQNSESKGRSSVSIEVSNKRYVEGVIYKQVRIMKASNPSRIKGTVTLKKLS